MKNRTAVIKVLYEKIEVNYNEVIAISSSFEYFLIINNSQNEIANNYKEISNFDILNNYNEDGLAGAYNLGISYLTNICPNFLLFLDDDTSSEQLLDLFDDQFYASFNDNSVAAVSPIYIDSNSMTRGLHLLLKQFSFNRIPRDFIGISNVSFMINSCSVWRFDSFKKIGKYDEKMKVDHIDTDYCLRAIENGYKLILNSNYYFIHTIGNRITYRFLNTTLRSGNHSPERRKMIMMNSILVLRKHFYKFPVFFYIILERIIYEFLGIIMIEKNKTLKLKMSLLGLIKGAIMTLR
jgi:rhamnosyltransferase